METPSVIIKKIIKRMIAKQRNECIRNILSIATFESIHNIKPDKIYSIGIVVPELHRYTGGHTSILRLGTYLCSYGYRVYYISYVNQDIKKMENIIKANFSSAKGECIDYNDMDKHFDVVIATNWISVYYAKKIDGYKLYFVQDYEPYFYAQGEEYVLAEQTYKMGFHIVSLGKWNLDEIKRNNNDDVGDMDYIEFPYEPKEYKLKIRDFNEYARKRRFIIAVYTKENGKRLHNIIEYMLKKAYTSLKTKDIQLDIRFFGLQKDYKVSIGENLGKLTQTEMTRLFDEADFGMSASLTNISLVPLEMIASGLPIIEIKQGSYSSFFSEDTAILVDFNYKGFVDILYEYIRNPDLVKDMSNKAYSEVMSLSWDKSCNQFCSILENIINK